MLAGTRKIALVLLIAVLPVHTFAAIATPHCQQDMAAAHDHAHPNGHPNDHDVSGDDHEHPLTSGDPASDHCGAGSAFAPPAASVGWANDSTVPHDSFTAAHCFGFIPEQPQRPPLA